MSPADSKTNSNAETIAYVDANRDSKPTTKSNAQTIAFRLANNYSKAKPDAKVNAESSLMRVEGG